MSLRTRLLLAFAVVVFVPVALLAAGLRQQMNEKLEEEYSKRLESVVSGINEYLRFESDGIERRLSSLARAASEDSQLRAAVGGVATARTYLLDYAGSAMDLAGLSMLQIQDEEGRIVSSGHFRNEHGRVDPAFFEAINRAPGKVALVEARTAGGTFLALARARRFSVADRTLTLVGGVALDADFLQRLVRGTEVVTLVHSEGRISSSDAKASRGEAANGGEYVRRVAIPLLRGREGGSLEQVEAALQITQSLSLVQQLVRSADALFVVTAASTAVVALLLAVWVSSRISRPIADLADKTAVLDLDRLDVQFDEGTDEVGRLSRVLRDLAERLRVSSSRIREAERRATIGDLARQINHDIKNGLVPLRNVMRHLTQVARDEPAALPAVLGERRDTIDSSIGYLETLATNYERLSTPASRRDCDLNGLIADVVRGSRGHEQVEFRTQFADDLPRVVADPVAVRRILENLVTNAVDSLPSASGRIAVSTTLVAVNGEPPLIRITVADNGRGMSPEEQSRMLEDFYTTKPGGSGLGLSIVRRLVMDLHGTLRVQSEVGRGTQMMVDIPVRSTRQPSSGRS